MGPPTDIFVTASSTSAWKALGSASTAVPYTLSATTRTLGYLVIGFPPGTPAPAAPAAGGPPVVLLVAVAAAALVVLAGLPLAMARRGEARSGRKRRR